MRWPDARSLRCVQFFCGCNSHLHDEKGHRSSPGAALAASSSRPRSTQCLPRAVALSKWLPALWLVVNAKNGISSCELARALSIAEKRVVYGPSYPHRDPTWGRDRSCRQVFPVDESYIGGLAQHAQGRSGKRRSRAPTQERRPPCRSICASPRTAIRPWLLKFFNTRAAGCFGRTSASMLVAARVPHRCVERLPAACPGIRHKFIDHAQCYAKDGVTTNNLENFWALLKRTLKTPMSIARPFTSSATSTNRPTVSTNGRTIRATKADF